MTQASDLTAGLGSSYDNEVAGRTGNWMQTRLGRQFWPLDPRPEDIRIFDIAHALAMQCRYNGHCNVFYSVAEHSVLVSLVVPPAHALAGLLHDAAEAYVGDLVRPLKRHIHGYDAIEDRVWRAIAERYGVPVDLHESVKIADNAVLLAEQAQIMGPPPEPWNVPGEPAAVTINGLNPNEARSAFLDRFTQLTGETA